MISAELLKWRPEPSLNINRYCFSLWLLCILAYILIEPPTFWAATLSKSCWLKCNYTVFRKNTHSRFLSDLDAKCLDFHKIFRSCLGQNKYSASEKVRYFLLSVTSCWRRISVLVKYGFYHRRQTFGEMLKHITVLTECKNMLICHAIFHCELFP